MDRRQTRASIHPSIPTAAVTCAFLARALFLWIRVQLDAATARASGGKVAVRTNASLRSTAVLVTCTNIFKMFRNSAGSPRTSATFVCSQQNIATNATNSKVYASPLKHRPFDYIMMIIF